MAAPTLARPSRTIDPVDTTERRGPWTRREGAHGALSSTMLLERNRGPRYSRVGPSPERTLDGVWWDSPGGPSSRASGQPPPGSRNFHLSVGPPPFSGAPMKPHRRAYGNAFRPET